jgi:hypothetical protein
MFDDATRRAIASHAARLKFEEAALLAVCEIESGGRLFATVAGRQEPLIRFEGHYFDDRLTGDKLAQSRKLGLAHPKAGAVKNPASQATRWSRLYLPASKISAQAAFESTSWGLGQVMGAHWKWLGYASPAAMLRRARSGAAGQIELMVRYIEKAGLVDELQRLDFAAFTRGYNGPGGIKAGYHTRMKAAYGRWAGKEAVSGASGMLRMGSKGAKVRELQALLVRAGHAVKVDGDFGPSTKQAVVAFQKANKLTVDGVAGPETVSALSAFKVAPEEKPGEQPATQVPEVQQSAGGGVLVAFVTSIRDKIAEVAYGLFGVEAETAQMIANGLLTASAVIGVGLAAYGLWGWWKSRQTKEAPA